MQSTVQQWHIYILETATGTLYTGITTSLDRRISEHASRSGKGAKYTKAHGVAQVLYTETVANKGSALRRELAIKKMTRIQKLNLIEQGAQT
jgi:putative endonuclease